MTKRQDTIRQRIECDFSALALDGEQTRRCRRIQAVLGGVALHLVDICPELRELHAAINKLDEAVHWAHAAIAASPRRALSGDRAMTPFSASPLTEGGPWKLTQRENEIFPAEDHGSVIHISGQSCWCGPVMLGTVLVHRPWAECAPQVQDDLLKTAKVAVCG